MNAVFGDRFVRVYDTTDQTKVIAAGLKAGLPITWTRPAAGNYRQPHTVDSYRWLLAILDATGADVTERPVRYRHEDWLFGTAVITSRANVSTK